jgi:hypothetical protein
MTIETKYNSGDEVWFMFKDKPVKEKVTNFDIKCHYAGGSGSDWGSSTFPIVITYDFTPSGQDKMTTVNEAKCFPSKEELLKSL